MKELKRKYFLLSLVLLCCGLYLVPSYGVQHDGFSFSSRASLPGEKKNSFSKEDHHHAREIPVYEIVEQTSNNFQKDLAGDACFSWLALKDRASSFLNLLSKQLSLNKPFLITHYREAIYLALRILRL
ncbi:MAG: hypothetical protein LRY55_15815 [Leadbetterella sp.]|nr:hypothetical protein [Leadbetterella sp.]